MSIDFLTYIDGSSIAFGYAAEKMIAHELRKHLGKAYRVKVLYRAGHDLEITNRATKQTLRVEVKAARKNKKGTYKAILKKDDKYGQTDCSKSDLIILAVFNLGSAGDNPTLFFIPTSQVKSAYVEIPKDVAKYGGKYAQFRADSIKSIERYL